MARYVVFNIRTNKYEKDSYGDTLYFTTRNAAHEFAVNYIGLLYSRIDLLSK